MKRCSQCEFVYEDEQGVCDMDGSELVYEPTLYPPATNSTTTSPLKFRSRSFILTTAATLIMGTFLAIGFYGVSSRPSRPTSAMTPAPSASVPPSAVAQPEMVPTPDNTRSEPTDPVSNRKSADVKPKNGSSSAEKPSASGSRTTTTREVKKPAPAQPKKEENSKVGGLLKKTGRILKKPFKF